LYSSAYRAFTLPSAHPEGMRNLPVIILAIPPMFIPPTTAQKRAVEGFQEACVGILKKQHAIPQIDMSWDGPGYRHPAFTLRIEGPALNKAVIDQVLKDPTVRELARTGCTALTFRNTTTKERWDWELKQS
jgi:hypothetical protein